MSLAISRVEELIPNINQEGLLNIAEIAEDTQSQNRVQEKTKQHLFGKGRDLNYAFIGSNYATSFGKFVYRDFKEGLGDIKEKELYTQAKEALKRFDGEIVIDLGAGKNTDGYRIAELGKAESYVAVETINFDDLKDILTYFRTKERADETLLPYTIVPEDMLSFLKRLPNKSVSVFAGGISEDIIVNKEYLRNVAKEISRVLSDRGAFISTSSEIHPDDLQCLK